MIKKIKIAITGSNGTLGRRFKKIYKNYSYKSLDFDITNKSKVKKWIEKNNFDIFIHFAAIVPTNQVERDKNRALKVNYYGTKFIVDSLLNKKGNFFFFYASTSHVYNFSKNKLKENSKAKPINYYGRTKLKSEEYIKKNMKNIPYAIGRIFSFSDSNQSDLYFIPSVFKKIKKKKNLYSFYKLNKKRDFISTRDIASAINFICTKKKEGLFNIGSSKGYFLKDIVKLINKMFFKRKKIIFNDIKNNEDLISDNTKLKKIGWRPRDNIKKILKSYYEKK